MHSGKNGKFLLFTAKEDPENEDPPTKINTHCENEVQKKLVLPLRTKIMYIRHYKNEDLPGNLARL